MDAIFGTGLRGPAKGFSAEAIQALNVSEVNVLAVDVPSGLYEGMPPISPRSESASEASACVHAQATVTIGLPKLMLAVEPGVRLCGVVTIADIGFPSDLLEDESIRNNLLGVAEMKASLPARDPAGHKGTFGRVGILAGSEGMTGAAVLAAQAAVRSGAGLVYSVYPKSLTTIM
ncbi:MAG: NAD(P)H-hydrate epimerase, partial [Thermoanaerobaculia bacterium]